MNNQVDSRSWFEKGRYFKKQKDYNNAIVCFQTMLKANPQDTLALNELYKCCLLVGRSKEGVDTVNALMRFYVIDEKKLEALTVYGELMQLKPEHAFDQDLQLALIDWLEEVEDFEGSLSALRNYALRYPHDKRVPDLLLRAARLCHEKLKDKTRTREFTEIISSQYPDSRAAGEAALLFFDSEV
jgi:tetratricopeptide (TPR) repeat protein